MNRHQVTTIVRQHIERQFPKACACCGRVFPDVVSYLNETCHLGAPMSYDAENDDWTPQTPLGAASFANCPCGSTLVITSEGMKRWTMWRLLAWLRVEMHARGTDAGTILRELRDEIDAEVRRDQASFDSDPCAAT